MLKIDNISASVSDKEILKGLNLEINKGEIHVIMGPNGAGKSTLANVILNNKMFKKTDGQILFENEDITNLSTDKIAQKGIFLSFQTPIEIPGISTVNFLKYIKSKIDGKVGSNLTLNKKINNYIEELNMDENLLKRNLNVGFSGGEKKKNEILQLLVINPKLAILDETDSGLDFDAIKAVSKGINLYKNEENAVLIITHNINILKDLKVDYVHLLIDGKIVKTSDRTLIDEIAQNGYSEYGVANV